MNTTLKICVILASTLLTAPSALAQSGDAEKGEKIFKKCKACHKVGEDAKNGVGPVLNDVIGRTAGTFEGYKYGKSTIAAGAAGLIWTEETIAEYVEDPKKFLREFLDDPKAKSKMSLKLKKEADRENVAAYVATFSAPIEVMDDMTDETTVIEEDASDEVETDE